MLMSCPIETISDQTAITCAASVVSSPKHHAPAQFRGDFDGSGAESV